MTCEQPSTDTPMTQCSSKNESVTIDAIADGVQQLVARYRETVLELVSEMDPRELCNDYGFGMMLGEPFSPAGVASLAVSLLMEQQFAILERGVLRLVVSQNPSYKGLPIDDELIAYQERKKRIFIILWASDPDWGRPCHWGNVPRHFAAIRGKLLRSKVGWVREIAHNSEIIGIVFRTYGQKEPFVERYERARNANGQPFKYIVVSGQAAWALVSNGNWDLHGDRLLSTVRGVSLSPRNWMN